MRKGNARGRALIRLAHRIEQPRYRGVKRLEMLLDAVDALDPIELPFGYDGQSAEDALNRVFDALVPLQGSWCRPYEHDDWRSWEKIHLRYDSLVRHRLFDPGHEPSWTQAYCHAAEVARIAYEEIDKPPKLAKRLELATEGLVTRIGDGRMADYVRAALRGEFPREELHWPTTWSFDDWLGNQLAQEERVGFMGSGYVWTRPRSE